jgi:hypothetical protein
MKRQNGLMVLESQQEFLDTIMLDKSIIYLLVDWSGQERMSRAVVYKTLNDLNKDGTPVFQIDCSDQTKEYVVEWLTVQQDNKQDFYFGGYGETLLVAKGKLIDFIKYPGQLGLEKTKEKLTEWKYSR